MRIHTSEVERNVCAQRVRVSRMKNGRWVIDRGNCSTELPANTFTCWEHAEWTGNAWANEEYEQSLAETE